MLLLASYDVVFQEVPGETTLALNLSDCPHCCEGCHSPHLQQAVGEPLDSVLLEGLLVRYGDAVTCVGFMGGDGDLAEVNRQAAIVKRWGADLDAASRPLKTAWYSGYSELPPEIELKNFDYIKLGPYIEGLGPLGSPTTNQKFYRVEDGKMINTIFASR